MNLLTVLKSLRYLTHLFQLIRYNSILSHELISHLRLHLSNFLIINSLNMTDSDSLQDTIPVFCTAPISKEVCGIY